MNNHYTRALKECTRVAAPLGQADFVGTLDICMQASMHSDDLNLLITTARSIEMLERLGHYLECLDKYPVSQIQAMAALTCQQNECTYTVPDVDKRYTINWSDSAPRCTCGAPGNCDHIKALELFLAQR